MATLDSSDSGNDIDLTTLKGLFTVTEKVELLASWEINSSDITRLWHKSYTKVIRNVYRK